MLQAAGVQWYPVLDDDLPRISFTQPWIHPIYAPPPPPKWFVGHFLFNYALDLLARGSEGIKIQDQDYYSIITDDDFYEPDFFKKLSRLDGDAIITSMKRGDHSVGRHPKTTLLARPDFMRRGLVSLEQLFLSGRLARTMRLERSFDSDGLLVEQVVERHQVTYAPEAFVWFNYLEPGRWDDSPVSKPESLGQAARRVATRFLYEQKLKLPKAVAGRRLSQRKIDIRR
jgi:hypothetical protein